MRGKIAGLLLLLWVQDFRGPVYRTPGPRDGRATRRVPNYHVQLSQEIFARAYLGAYAYAYVCVCVLEHDVHVGGRACIRVWVRKVA